MVLMNGHDGSLRLMMFPSTIRIVCNNTFTMALARAGEQEHFVKIRHTKTMHDKIDLAQETLGLAVKSVESTTDMMKAMASKRLTVAQTFDIIDQLVPMPKLPEGKDTSAGVTRAQNRRNRLLELNEAGIGTDIVGVRGTGWGLFNAVTEFTTHEFNVKPGVAKEHAEYNQRKSEALLNSTWFGKGAELNEKAAKLILAI